MSSTGSIITFRELWDQLGQGSVAPCYFFYGPEDVLIDRSLQLLKEAAIEPGTEDFTWSIFRADDEMDWSSFADALTSLPLLAFKRVVVLKHAGKASTAKGAQSVIERTLQQPSADLTLVLIEMEANDKKALYRKWMERCTSVYFPQPKPFELQKFLIDTAGKFHKKVTEEALSRILADSNPQLRDLLSKMEVLIFFVGDKNTIEASDVDACTVFSREVEIFKLLQAIGCRDAPLARLTLHQLLSGRGDIGGLIHLLYRQIWALYRMKYLAEKKVPAAQWSAQLNLKPPFLEKRYREYLPHYSRRELGISLELLAEADAHRKLWAADDEQIFWMLTENLLDPAAGKK